MTATTELTVPAEARRALRTAIDEDSIQHGGVSICSSEDGVRVTRSGSSNEYPNVEMLAQQHAALVTDWFHWERIVGGHETAGRTLLRWLERTDELSLGERYDELRAGYRRTWGQLSVSVRCDRTGRRAYELRHESDAERAADELRPIDPVELTEIARSDANGEYRPLRGAPTLQRGWRLAADADAIVRAIDDVYPASVANWDRARTDELEPIHFSEMAKRQTGHLEALTEATPDSVSEAVREHCQDCLKRRCWGFEEAGDLDPGPTGDDRLVCPEACAVVQSAVRSADGHDHDHSH